MGMRITKLRPFGGFCAETAGAVTLIGTALAGIPVSTTQTISGSIMGVGAIQRFSAVRWGVAGKILSAGVFTTPPPAPMAPPRRAILPPPGPPRAHMGRDGPPALGGGAALSVAELSC